MIKILVDPNIEQKYLSGVKPLVDARLNFYVVTFASIIANDTAPIAAHPINGNTKNALLNVLLPANDEITGANGYVELLQPLRLHADFQPARHLTYLNFLNQIKPKVSEILISKPNALLELNQEIELLYPHKAVAKILKMIFCYNCFNGKEWDYNSHRFVQDLNVSVCPYCNRNYITSVADNAGNKIIGPTLDHFFSQTDFPLLSVSLYNLVPSCSICNSNLKGAVKFNLNDFVHPYIANFGSDAFFKYSNVGVGQYKIQLRKSSRISAGRSLQIFGPNPNPNSSGNAVIFAIENIYDVAHQDAVAEIHEKTDANSIYYAEVLINTFPGIKANLEDFYRYYFGNYYDESDFGRRPLSKLTRDLVRQRLPHIFP